MPSIFLSHTSIDKPFVEKLARDLKAIGVAVWYDKWEIKVGDSLTQRIEQGIRECEYLAIVLSPESVQSEWVKNELGAGWAKQIRTKQIIVLPIYYRECEMPSLLEDRRYADFRSDYNTGFASVAQVLGIEEFASVSRGNWRLYAKTKSVAWQKFRDLEFEELVTALINQAIKYNWSSWVGKSKNPYSLTLSAGGGESVSEYISIKLDGRAFAYKASFKPEWNPNHLKASDFGTYIGNTVNECEEFVWRCMDRFRHSYGDPTGIPCHSVLRNVTEQQKLEMAYEFVKKLSWYKGEELL